MVMNGKSTVDQELEQYPKQYKRKIGRQRYRNGTVKMGEKH